MVDVTLRAGHSEEGAKLDGGCQYVPVFRAVLIGRVTGLVVNRVGQMKAWVFWRSFYGQTGVLCLKLECPTGQPPHSSQQ